MSQFFAEVREFLLKFRKKIWEKSLFTFSLQSLFSNKQDEILMNLPKFFCFISKGIRSKFENFYRIMVCFQKTLKVFFWAGRMQFWQPCREFLFNVRYFFSLSPNKFLYFISILLLLNFVLFLKCSSGHAECIFDRRSKNVCLNVQIEILKF